MVLCLETVVVYSVRTGELPALCAYSPSDQAVLWRRVTAEPVGEAVTIDPTTFAIIDHGELQLCSLANGAPIRRIALASLPWAPSVERDNHARPLSGDRFGVSFHSPRLTPSGLWVWRGSYRSEGWGVIGDTGELRLSAPDGRWVGYAPNGRPLLQSGYINPRIMTIREEKLVDATDLLFRKLKGDYPDMDFGLFPCPEFSAPGKLVVAMRRRDAPRPANGRIHYDRVVVLHVDSGSFQLMRSAPRHEFYESWAVHQRRVYRYSSRIDQEVEGQHRRLWIEVYDLETGRKRAERSLAGLDHDGDLLLRGFAPEGDAVFVYQKDRDPPPPGFGSWADSRVLLLDASSLATRRSWSLSVDGRPAWIRDVELSNAHGIVQTFGSAAMMRMPSRGTRRHAMGVRALDPSSGEERWRHTEHMILEPLRPERYDRRARPALRDD